jgi:hypothetical protein
MLKRVYNMKLIFKNNKKLDFKKFKKNNQMLKI